MKKAHLVLSSVAAVIGALVLAFVTKQALLTQFPPRVSGCPNFGEAKASVAGKSLRLAVADAATERFHGLSGCSSIPENSGMYFDLQAKEVTAFWMKDMLIPLDIIWITDGKAVGIVQNAPVPKPDTPLIQLPRYTSPEPVTAVLEVPAGYAKTLGIQKGTAIEVKK